MTRSWMSLKLRETREPEKHYYNQWFARRDRRIYMVVQALAYRSRTYGWDATGGYCHDTESDQRGYTTAQSAFDNPEPRGAYRRKLSK